MPCNVTIKFSASVANNSPGRIVARMVHEVLAGPPARPAPNRLRPAPPRELQLEVTGSCNLRCEMCPVSYSPEIGKREGSLSFETFQKLVDELPDLETITLQGLGEPLLAPHLLAMIRYATARGIEVGFNTNGMFLTRRPAEELLGAGLSWLHISLDGATVETYEGIRGGARFEKVAANVKSLIEVKTRRRAELPRVSLVFVAMRRNLEELPALVDIAADWGVGRLWVQNLSHAFGDTDPAGH